jgi:hypothetical protein
MLLSAVLGVPSDDSADLSHVITHRCSFVNTDRSYVNLYAYSQNLQITHWAGIAQSVKRFAGRSGDRIPVWATFSAHVQTGPGAHPASYTMGTGSFPGVKKPGRGVEHPPHLAPRLKKE